MVKKNIFSIFIALFIMYLSLTGSDTFDKVPLFNIRFFDKMVHFGIYFVLMSVIIFENRKSFKNTSYLFLIGLIPLFFGISMEILQSTLTTSRSGSFYDVLFNSAGILVSILIWIRVKPFTEERIR